MCGHWLVVYGTPPTNDNGELLAQGDFGPVSGLPQRRSPCEGVVMTEEAEHQNPDPSARLSPAFLEDVLGEEALRWVKQRSSRAEEAFRDSGLEDRLLRILEDPRRIARATLRGGYAYNFWTDKDHPRGLWRRQPQRSYLDGKDEWEVLLDVDALSIQEGKSWVWHGASIRYPQADRALVALSEGGTDADETREFDLETRKWVPDGFFRPSGKGSLSWIDLNHCWLTQPTALSAVSASGYPLEARLLTRGQRLEDAPVIQSGDQSDMGVWAGTYRDRLGSHSRIDVMEDFYSSKTYIGPGDAAKITRSSFKRLGFPPTSEASVWGRWALAWLRKDWTRTGQTWPAGSVVAVKLAELTADAETASAHPVFTPTDTQVIEDMAAVRDHLILTFLDNVVPRLRIVSPAEGGVWESHALPLPEELTYADPFLTIEVTAVDAPASNDLWAVTTGYKTPPTLWLLKWETDRYLWRQVRQGPPLYDASNVTVSQHFATSEDGTRVPYFQVSAANRRPSPTLLCGYGGFNVSLLPTYSPGMGAAWLEKGGIYVVANIRGGGEFGPRWHAAALREKRQAAYQDFVAVARDLVARGVTTAAQLGMQGGSNGGLLAGNMYTQYPDDFGAIVCQVPLLDMGRFHTLLAGHSWVAEYGNPDDPEDWEFIQRFSPVHLFDTAKDYPPLFLTTSTRDDRVHPGHARSLAYLAEQAGKNVFYYENTEGGHAGAADNRQRAHTQALTWRFLWAALKGAD